MTPEKTTLAERDIERAKIKILIQDFINSGGRINKCTKNKKVPVKIRMDPE